MSGSFLLPSQANSPPAAPSFRQVAKMDLGDGLFRTVLLSHLYGHIDRRTILQHNMLPQHRKHTQSPQHLSRGGFFCLFPQPPLKSCAERQLHPPAGSCVSLAEVNNSSERDESGEHIKYVNISGFFNPYSRAACCGRRGPPQHGSEPHHSPAGISPSLRWGALTHPSKPEHSIDFPCSIITAANKINK